MEIKLIGGPFDGKIIEQPEGIRCVAVQVSDEKHVPEMDYLSYIYKGADGVLSYSGMHWVNVNNEGHLLVYHQPVMEIYLTSGPLDGQRMVVPAELTTLLVPIARSEEDIQRQRNAVKTDSEIDPFKYAHVYSMNGSTWTYEGIKEVDMGEGVRKFGTVYHKGIEIKNENQS